MKSLRLAVPLVLAAFTLTCQGDQTTPVAPDDVGIRAAPGGGGKPAKADPNPTGCSDGQTAKWDDASSEWVCADDQTQGVFGWQVVTEELVVAVPGGVAFHPRQPALCPLGKRVIGGGASRIAGSGPPTLFFLQKSFPIIGATEAEQDGWEAEWYVDAVTLGGSWTGRFKVWANCASVS